MVNRFIVYLFLVASVITGSLQAAQNSHIDQGNVFAKSGKYKEALGHLNSAIQEDPQNARAYKLRGHVHYAMGNYVKAFADLDRVVALAPNSANALVDRAIVYSVSGKHSQAMADIEHALSIKPDSAFAKAVKKEILQRAK